jgi:hypothetical protein
MTSQVRCIWDWGAKVDKTPRWLRQWRHRRALRKQATPGVQMAALASGYFFVTEVAIMVTALLIVAAFSGGAYIGVKYGSTELAVVKAELAKIKAKL